MQRSLCEGEREKAELMQSLARIKDDLNRLSAGGNGLNSCGPATSLDSASPHASALSLLGMCSREEYCCVEFLSGGRGFNDQTKYLRAF